MQNGPTELKKSHKIQLPFISWDIANTRFEKIKSDVILSYFLLFIYETAECRFLHILQNLMPSMKSWVNLLQNGQIRLKKSHRVQLSHYREMYNIEETKQCINCITFSKNLHTSGQNSIIWNRGPCHLLPNFFFQKTCTCLKYKILKLRTKPWRVNWFINVISKFLQIFICLFYSKIMSIHF